MSVVVRCRRCGGQFDPAKLAVRNRCPVCSPVPPVPPPVPTMNPNVVPLSHALTRAEPPPLMRRPIGEGGWRVPGWVAVVALVVGGLVGWFGSRLYIGWQFSRVQDDFNKDIREFNARMRR